MSIELPNAHVKTVEEVLAHFDVDPEAGLTSEQVEASRKLNGSNGKAPSPLPPPSLSLSLFIPFIPPFPSHSHFLPSLHTVASLIIVQFRFPYPFSLLLPSPLPLCSPFWSHLQPTLGFSTFPSLLCSANVPLPSVCGLASAISMFVFLGGKT
eukprot:TRINITY_DN1319_c1_g1_i1.p1 TRINITY_DN1319_c1_g1~~TRINITY_DN1319_c1_g1_i1.p1  ORF type:complete len:153 (-),score=1.03 TRINITY_DN1319_c1_g1_i1:189-647(-)